MQAPNFRLLAREASDLSDLVSSPRSVLASRRAEFHIVPATNRQSPRGLWSVEQLIVVRGLISRLLLERIGTAFCNHGRRQGNNYTPSNMILLLLLFSLTQGFVYAKGKYLFLFFLNFNVIIYCTLNSLSNHHLSKVTHLSSTICGLFIIGSW